MFKKHSGAGICAALGKTVHYSIWIVVIYHSPKVNYQMISHIGASGILDEMFENIHGSTPYTVFATTQLPTWPFSPIGRSFSAVPPSPPPWNIIYIDLVLMRQEALASNTFEDS
jgi:hypothetical protein